MLPNIDRILWVVALISAAAWLTAAERLRVEPIQPGPLAKYEVASLSPTLAQQGTQFTEAGNPQKIGEAFAGRVLSVKQGDYAVKNAYITHSTGVTHIYLKQRFQGIEVANGDMAVHVDSNGHIIAYSDGFYRGTDVSKRQLWSNSMKPQYVAPGVAFKALADYIGKPVDTASIVAVPQVGGEGDGAGDGDNEQYTLEGIPYALESVVVRRAYIHTKDDELQAVWDFRINLGDNYFNAHVSANGARVLALNDWVADAAYNVVKVGDADPMSDRRTLVVDPADATASPNGWHDLLGMQTTTTTGNNVDAEVPASVGTSSVRPTSANRVFDYALDLTKEPSAYQPAAVTNLFYMNNIMHDISYHYGFDEPAGNFQERNYGNGGRGGDYVRAHAQSPAGVNNADFLTPPDGQRPRMRMYIWTRTRPSRDSDFSNDIIAHEYTHGISNRLTGGPANVNCLGGGEAGGMGEGWGDFFAVWLRLKSTDTHRKTITIGTYVTVSNLRRYPYSTRKFVNPTTYGLINDPQWREVHSIGEIWANILYQLYWNLTDKLGYTNDKYSVDKSMGNTLTLKLVMDGMKLQPCNPTFVSARNAILQAEQQITRGQHRCAIWSAFAFRGVGVGAFTDGRGNVREDFSVPADCS
ncbi:zinc-dependent metalloprotease [Syncephalis pseudoplumigaleata]|uniref:Extracellular metalloproteinase n=1 Tax=Syncephalis pseudoplumigaleata TaxID=1712513 RepID=A0A4P9YVA3_9FUNG|nr:zinc-dependent metalloprotease [Syncephalis pseudoplumigaleata]|eukprot:RKP23342.1 zinc-dependent metalloprotease [Syncephalis pseudoplumigaleata]